VSVWPFSPEATKRGRKYDLKSKTFVKYVLSCKLYTVTKVQTNSDVTKCKQTMTSSRFLWNNTKIIIKLGTADDELWPMIQRKLDVLNKAGLSKDNFMASESHTVTTSSANSNGEAKITDFFSTSLTEEDIAALDDDYDVEEYSSKSIAQEAKRPRL
jgi:hypothetical protein